MKMINKLSRCVSNEYSDSREYITLFITPRTGLEDWRIPFIAILTMGLSSPEGLIAVSGLKTTHRMGHKS